MCGIAYKMLRRITTSGGMHDKFDIRHRENSLSTEVEAGSGNMDEV